MHFLIGCVLLLWITPPSLCRLFLFPHTFLLLPLRWTYTGTISINYVVQGLLDWKQSDWIGRCVLSVALLAGGVRCTWVTPGTALSWEAQRLSPFPYSPGHSGIFAVYLVGRDVRGGRRMNCVPHSPAPAFPLGTGVLSNFCQIVPCAAKACSCGWGVF